MSIEMKKISIDDTADGGTIDRFLMVDRADGLPVGGLDPFVQGDEIIAYQCVYWGDEEDASKFRRKTVRKEKGEAKDAFIKRSWRTAYELTPNGYW